MIRVAILASGQGTIAESLYSAALKHPQTIAIPLLICDNTNSNIKNRFKKYNREITTIEKKGSKSQHESEIYENLKKAKVDWIFLAGYMQLLSSNFISKFPNRIINIHPSLLPKYPGLRGYERTFDAGDKLGGISIHFVDEGMDTGPIIQQYTFERKEKDTLEDFIKRGKALEMKVYPQIFEKLLLEGIVP